MNYTYMPVKNILKYGYGYTYNDEHNMEIFDSISNTLYGYCKSIGINLGSIEPKDRYNINKRVEIYQYAMQDVDDPTTIMNHRVILDGKLKDLLQKQHIPYIYKDYSKLNNNEAYTSFIDNTNDYLLKNKLFKTSCSITEAEPDTKFSSNRTSKMPILTIEIDENYDIGIINMLSDYIDTIDTFINDDYFLCMHHEYDADANKIKYQIELCAKDELIGEELVYTPIRNCSDENELRQLISEDAPDDCPFTCEPSKRKELILSKKCGDCRKVCKKYIMNNLKNTYEYECYEKKMINESTAINKLLDTIDISIDNDGDIIVSKKEYDSFDYHFKKSSKMLVLYKKNEDITGIKNELCKVSYMIKMIELYHLSPTDNPEKRKEQEKLLDLRSVMINAFNYYLSYVISKEKNFYFNDYFDNSKYGKSYKINVEGFGKFAKKLIKIFI